MSKTPLNKESVGKYFIITDLNFSDFMKDEDKNIALYDTLEEASSVCGMYEFPDAIVCQIKYNHIEDDVFAHTANYPETKFEYLRLIAPDTQRLKRLGDQGWEMCGYNDPIYFFKRRLTPITEASLEVADIRNKISPLVMLLSLIEDAPEDKIKYIDDVVKESKKAINHLAQRNVY